ncbi:hypothetical protein XELAEV_18029441mg [Xenopus laevis]|uniref:Uncharacterized protein n=1 Tax=Xenopus laevis TaxID=8355 RepID=A0A974HHJ8_XENLA|nr:hypothetical protein XELAEV_18029441mg [Xenopus laevis]
MNLLATTSVTLQYTWSTHTPFSSQRHLEATSIPEPLQSLQPHVALNTSQTASDAHRHPWQKSDYTLYLLQSPLSSDYCHGK